LLILNRENNICFNEYFEELHNYPKIIKFRDLTKYVAVHEKPWFLLLLQENVILKCVCKCTYMNAYKTINNPTVWQRASYWYDVKDVYVTCTSESISVVSR